MIKMPYIFSDNMVLQEGRDNLITGECTGDVEVEFRGETYRTECKNGKFAVKIPCLGYAEGLRLTVRCGEETKVMDNVAVGEVWLAAGQSNMEWSLKDSTDGMFDKQFCNFNGKVRFITAAAVDEERKNTKKEWLTAEKETGEISACGYYFASRIYEALNVPVGIIDCNKSASSIFHWIDEKESLANCITAPYVRTYNSALNNIYTNEYSVMGSSYMLRYGYFYDEYIKPICDCSIRGVLWYQGEADGAGKESADIYREAFKMLDRELKNTFRDSNLKIISVILASYGGEWIGGENGKQWAYMRDAQIKASIETGNYFVSALDRGFINNIHPSEKKFVGERLAGCALAEIYGKDIKWKCPTLKEIKIEDGILKIYFNNTYGRLYEDCGESADIEIKDFYRLRDNYTAHIKDDHIEVEVGSRKIKRVAHCFKNFPYVRIFNGIGMPALPFCEDID